MMAGAKTTTTPPIILSGMPGSGKSTVGPLLARILAAPFVDLDKLFREKFEMSPAAAIRRHGEGFFRRKEEELLGSLATEGPRVVACGGGTLTSRPTLDLALGTGALVSLLASPRTLARRLQDASDHPLLDGDDLLQNLERLLAKRGPYYEQSHIQQETGGLSPVEVAFSVREGLIDLGVDGYRLRCLPAAFEEVPGGLQGYQELGRRSYPVHISGRPGIEGLRDHLEQVLPGRETVVFLDSAVGTMMGGELRTALAGRPVTFIHLPSGEEAKNFGRVGEHIRKMLDGQVKRSTCAIAVGGGSTLDAAGFICSIFMRGIPIAYVPTTFLAAVDAAVGGKTAMNLPAAKNAVGTFRQPGGVFVSAEVILDEIDKLGGKGGLAEFLKCCLLNGTPEAEIRTFADLAKKPADDGKRIGLVSRAIALALAYKMDVVARDECDSKGNRMVLNLGHTFAHVFESGSGYEVSHGKAVGWGLVVAARVSRSLGLCDDELPQLVESLATSFGLWPPGPLKLPAGSLEALLHDKKRGEGGISLVLLEALGKPVIFEEKPERVKKLLLSSMESIMEA